MIAVIKTGGKQYLVKPGDKIKIEKIEKEEEKEITFNEVLLIVDDKDNVEIGNPLIKSAKVKAKVLKQARAKKIIVFKYKPKKRYQKKKGHKQPYTEVEILEVVKVKSQKSKLKV